MILTTPNVSLLFSGFSFTFQQAYNSAPSWADQVASIIPSNTSQEIHFWLAQLPKMREWVGERVFNNLASYEQIVINKDWEDSLELDRNRVEDDQHGFFSATSIPMLAARAKKNPDYLLRDLLRAGHSTPSYDGQNHFDASHPINKFPGSGVSGTQSNYYSSGKALNYDNLVTVRANMMSLKDESGEPFEVQPDLLVVPPQLGAQARALATAEYAPKAYGTPGSESAATSQPNTMRGLFRVLELAELSADATTWYMLDTTKAVKPMIHQLRRAPVFVSLIAPNDPKVFEIKKYRFGVDSREAAAFGPWWMSAKMVALWRFSKARRTSRAGGSAASSARASRSTGPTRTRRSRSPRRSPQRSRRTR